MDVSDLPAKQSQCSSRSDSQDSQTFALSSPVRKSKFALAMRPALDILLLIVFKDVMIFEIMQFLKTRSDFKELRLLDSRKGAFLHFPKFS